METKTRRTRRVQDKVSDKINKNKIITEVVHHRKEPLRYLYPEECTDPLERKEFRRKARQKIRKMESEVNQLTGRAKERAQRKLLRLRENFLADVEAHI